MCSPTLAVEGATLALSAAQGVSQYQQAKATNQANAAQAQAQTDQAATQRDLQIGNRVKAARAEAARLRVSAGEAGVSGNSFESLLQNTFGRANQDIGIIQKQGGFTQKAIDTSLASANAKNHFSPVVAGLQIAGNTANAYWNTHPTKATKTKKAKSKS